jgi:hypothetical protein
MPTTPSRDSRDSHDLRDQPLDPPPSATSVRDLLAACAAARTVSTPPEDELPVRAPRAAARDAA